MVVKVTPAKKSMDVKPPAGHKRAVAAHKPALSKDLKSQIEAAKHELANDLIEPIDRPDRPSNDPNTPDEPFYEQPELPAQTRRIILAAILICIAVIVAAIVLYD